MLLWNLVLAQKGSRVGDVRLQLGAERIVCRAIELSRTRPVRLLDEPRAELLRETKVGAGKPEPGAVTQAIAPSGSSEGAIPVHSAGP